MGIPRKAAPPVVSGSRWNDAEEVKCNNYIGVRGSPEQVISSTRSFGQGGGQISRVVRVSARAPFGVCVEL